MQSAQFEFETLSLKKFSEKSYLDYSMYVILDRALPFVGDGLKPVQRRIVYAMSELGLQATAKFKKSARTVGDVIGKFHPHGDSAAYEAMVLMAQNFSYRYPLIDGQGNWGSVDDPKSFAAMRYTESKLTKYADLLLSELKSGTSDWQNNFDGALEEPVFLPARLPNILLNGSSGIAVGMSTDIPPHNLIELANACIYLLENKRANTSDLMAFIQAPDFPTKAEIITSKSDIQAVYESGTGSIKMRARYGIENDQVVIDALPHQVSGAKIIEQIAQQMRDKKLPMIDDLRDESDHKQPIRLVIIPRSNRVDIEQMMLHLFATTDLEKNIRVNLNIIGLNGKPKVKALHEILSEWLIFRTNTVKRRLQYRLDKIIDRLHILDGLLVAYLNIDEVIHIIREYDNPKVEMIQRFGLSETQVKAILDIKLRQLDKLEEFKINAEKDELDTERQELEMILSSEVRLKKLIKNEIKADAEIFGDKRKSSLHKRAEAIAIDPKSLIPIEAVTVVLSKKGWIRLAKGHDLNPENLSYKAGDSPLSASKGKSNQLCALLDSGGRVYTIENSQLPSARGQGEPLTGRLSPVAGVEFCSVITAAPDDLVLVAASIGYGFVTKFANLQARAKTGKAFLNKPEKAKCLGLQILNDWQNDYLVAISNVGRILSFKANELPQLTKGKGNKIISIPAAKFKSGEEFLAALITVSSGQTLKIISGKRYLRQNYRDIQSYEGKRGSRGKILPKGFQRIDRMEIE